MTSSADSENPNGQEGHATTHIPDEVTDTEKPETKPENQTNSTCTNSSTSCPFDSNKQQVQHQEEDEIDHDKIQTETEEQALSKNQIKKRKRYEKLMAIKKRKKQQDKDAKAAKAKAAGRDLDEERRLQAERTLSGEGHLKREQRWQQRLKPAESSFKVCIDCSFEESMTKKEIGSLSSQIRYCYSTNKKSYHPVYLSVSSLCGETYENLKRVEGFPDNWRTRAFDNSDKPLTEMHATHDLVYLTSDSTNVLSELDNSKTYVIGGIVDRNRLKSATINKAEELGIATARLPIDEHLKLCATKVLTCNHVFEILLKFKEHKDWKMALLDVLPARKDATTAGDAEEEDT